MARTLKDVMSIRRIPLDEERRRNAALWLYIVKRDLMDDFKEFYKHYRNQSPHGLEKLLMEEYRNILFGYNADDDEDL